MRASERTLEGFCHTYAIMPVNISTLQSSAHFAGRMLSVRRNETSPNLSVQPGTVLRTEMYSGFPDSPFWPADSATVSINHTKPWEHGSPRVLLHRGYRNSEVRPTAYESKILFGSPCKATVPPNNQKLAQTYCRKNTLYISEVVTKAHNVDHFVPLQPVIIMYRETYGKRYDHYQNSSYPSNSSRSSWAWINKPSLWECRHTL